MGCVDKNGYVNLRLLRTDPFDFEWTRESHIIEILCAIWLELWNDKWTKPSSKIPQETIYKNEFDKYYLFLDEKQIQQIINYWIIISSNDVEGTNLPHQEKELAWGSGWSKLICKFLLSNFS